MHPSGMHKPNYAEISVRKQFARENQNVADDTELI